MIDKVQIPSALVVQPTSRISVPNHVHFGHTTVINDQQEFLEAVEDGIESFCQLHLDERQMGAQDILNLFVEIIEEDRDPLTNQSVSYAERLGFIFGKIAGLLNPDLADPYYDHLTFLEALSYKCKGFYQVECQRDRHPSDIYQVTEQ